MSACLRSRTGSLVGGGGGSQLTYMRIQWTEETGTTGTAVFVMDAGGTNERQRTEWETLAGDPDWAAGRTR